MNGDAKTMLLVAKSARVIRSCETAEQIKVAEAFLKRTLRVIGWRGLFASHLATEACWKLMLLLEHAKRRVYREGGNEWNSLAKS
jgi:hypothetical protein